MNVKPLEILYKYYGYTSFRNGQEQIINSIVNKNDVLAIMPTGGGKSICYQLPALCLDGITIVISPLISLMKDQVDTLKTMGIEAELINSSLSNSEYSQILDNIDNNLDKLIDRTNKDIDKLNNGDKILDMQDLTDTRKVLDDLHNLVSDITDNYDSEIVPTINKGFDSMSEIIDTGLNLSAQGKKTLPDVQEMLNTFKNAADLSNDELKALKDLLNSIEI
ncbi:hypothetical protein SDC9_118153 [bioreactor metagenome]|uniref:DNA 3'-5' helicase n=1 Tax=bioreactor metagenome TaxID=1076179 RepID=A0A645C098_9ZZZZ